MAPFCRTLTFVFGPADCILRRSTFLRFASAANSVDFVIGAKILVMHFCCFVCAALQHHDHLAEWSSPLDADGQQAAAEVLMPTCRPGSSVLMAFSPGDKRNTAKVARTHPHRR
jgi:hypothetical protein